MQTKAKMMDSGNSEALLTGENFRIYSSKMQAMKLLTLILFFIFSSLSYGQDSLNIDTTVKTFTPTVQDTMAADSNSSASKGTALKNKKLKKHVRKKQRKEDLVVSKREDTKAVDAKGNVDGAIIIGLSIIAVVIGFAFSFSFFGTPDKPGTISSKDEDFISDYLSRMLLTRREYYNNVYLKSEAWKRKRHIILRRDNWRCVYCGGRATQVHHTRYAKLNIGKEPIEWLVSVCKSCHESKH